MKARSRRLFFALLAFALLFAQQGAAVHALSHLAEPPPAHSQQDKHLPHSPACDKCVVYAGVGGAVAASGLNIPAETVHLRPIAAIQPSPLSRFSSLYLARAPPALA